VARTNSIRLWQSWTWGDLDDHRHAAQQGDFVAPVKPVGFSRRKAQRDVGRSRRFPLLLGPRRIACMHIRAAVPKATDSKQIVMRYLSATLCVAATTIAAKADLDHAPSEKYASGAERKWARFEIVRLQCFRLARWWQILRAVGSLRARQSILKL
jgi:hypothetical protein